MSRKVFTEGCQALRLLAEVPDRELTEPDQVYFAFDFVAKNPKYWILTKSAEKICESSQEIK